MTGLSQRGKRNIPGSPIAGEDDLPISVGAGELRRARAHIEVWYRCEPGAFVDIQARIFDALDEIGRVSEPDLGNVLYEVDLTEHVVLSEEAPVTDARLGITAGDRQGLIRDRADPPARGEVRREGVG